MILVHLSKFIWHISEGLFVGFLIVFCWSICLSLCQYHAFWITIIHKHTHIHTHTYTYIYFRCYNYFFLDTYSSLSCPNLQSSLLKVCVSLISTLLTIIHISLLFSLLFSLLLWNCCCWGYQRSPKFQIQWMLLYFYIAWLLWTSLK